ncbi:hypothetical protein ES708_30371 [subsurface metagenome]
MSQRHKAVKATLDTGRASEWNDDHEENFSVRYGHCHDPLVPTLGDHWDGGQHTSGTGNTISLVGGHIAIRMRASGGAGNFATMRHEIASAAGNITNELAVPIFQIALDVQTPTADNATHEFGFMASAGACFAANQDGCFFRIDNNVLFAVSSDGAAETATNLGAPDQFAVYRVMHTATHDYFYVNDMVTPVATHTTDLSVADLTVKVTCADRAGGDNYINWQAIWLSFLRQTS